MQANARRIRKYEKRENQYSQNKMFKEDTKKFYRNVVMKIIEAREPPSMAETETYWKNERAEWIRRGQEGKLAIWVECLYRLRKLLHICLKLTIGNILEIIKYKITEFKLSQILTGILQKTSML